MSRSLLIFAFVYLLAEKTLKNDTIT